MVLDSSKTPALHSVPVSVLIDADFDLVGSVVLVGICLLLIGIRTLFYQPSSGPRAHPTRADSDPLYNAYMHSPEWRVKRIQCLRAANNTCAMCRNRFPDRLLRAHHLTYDRLYHEHPEDLLCLCQSCHQLAHPYRKVS
jgi:hypothetical protein